MRLPHPLRPNRAALALVLAACAPWSAAQGTAAVLGRWLTQKGDAVVEFFPCADRVCGKLAWLAFVPPDGSMLRDGKNPDQNLRSRTLCGLDMLGGFRRRDGLEWVDGWIYSPENGQTYKATLKVEQPDVLKLRGYVGVPLLGQTQVWTRAPDGFPPCGKG